MNYQLREATIADLDGIMNVEIQSFSLPWSREAFYNEFVKNHFARYFVIVDQEKIIGYCGVWLVVDEAHITNIAILPEYRGQKLGELLLSSIMDYSIQQGAKSMTLEVRVSNIIAQSLYKKLGFFEGGIRKNYYTDNQEDALVMWVNL
ncbi:MULTISPECIES: ribosomal protein S18-alanine N-acetyltransferase [Heyndrickxia]|nr:ribosomal-protein-alanine N-acetyltransferase [Heyndrickxia sporothermodurans]PTY77291.1 ribosomal-protein-alanine N-acetyltransferase [Heyndrickxia sporothermodurans]PTY87142.1 ribosomal-protein-alanine N-acetyltransferase [Heyndrickxia sporothermodurans]PTY88008.1 ribosomal-protein-alanine N-acetyltransferase [Heyndrickxia sporothermodurans]